MTDHSLRGLAFFCEEEKARQAPTHTPHPAEGMAAGHFRLRTNGMPPPLMQGHRNGRDPINPKTHATFLSFLVLTDEFIDSDFLRGLAVCNLAIHTEL